MRRFFRPIRFCKNFFYKVRAVIYWLPFIWKDKWWDWTFIMLLLEAKLRWDAKHYKKWGHHTGCEKSAKKMLVAAALCKRISENKYNLFFSFKLVPNKNVISEGEDDLRSFLDSHVEGEWIGQFGGNNWTKYNDYMIQQDIDYLFKILNKHMQGWWD